MPPGGAIPEEFICPISGDVMREPVWLDSGVTADWAYADCYLQAGFRTCPVTGEHLRSVHLIPVPYLRELILRWAGSVEFDIPRQPSYRVIMHAIMQDFDVASGKRASPVPGLSALPRASRREMDIAAGTANAPEPPLEPRPSARLNPLPGAGDDVTYGVAALSLASPESVTAQVSSHSLRSMRSSAPHEMFSWRPASNAAPRPAAPQGSAVSLHSLPPIEASSAAPLPLSLNTAAANRQLPLGNARGGGALPKYPRAPLHSRPASTGADADASDGVYAVETSAIYRGRDYNEPRPRRTATISTTDVSNQGGDYAERQISTRGASLGNGPVARVPTATHCGSIPSPMSWGSGAEGAGISSYRDRGDAYSDETSSGSELALEEALVSLDGAVYGRGMGIGSEAGKQIVVGRAVPRADAFHRASSYGVTLRDSHGGRSSEGIGGAGTGWGRPPAPGGVQASRLGSSGKGDSWGSPTAHGKGAADRFRVTIEIPTRHRRTGSVDGGAWTGMADIGHSVNTGRNAELPRGYHRRTASETGWPAVAAAPQLPPHPRMPASQRRLQDQAELNALVSQIREYSSRVVLEGLARLADILDSNDDMRSFFVNAGACVRLSQLVASENDPVRVAAARVIWHLARNPAAAEGLLAANVALLLFQGLARPELSDPLPLLGGLVHLNCHIRELAPLQPAGMELLVDHLLVGCRTNEDALAAAFCLLRMHKACQLAPPQQASTHVLEIIASRQGSLAALVGLLRVPFCSGLEAAVTLIGALAQHVTGVAADIVEHGGAPDLEELLRCPVASGRNAAAQSLAKLIAAYDLTRKKMSMDRVADPLCRMMLGSDAAGVGAAAWLMGYLAMDPAVRRPLVTLGVAPALVSALQRGDSIGREGAAWAASSIAVDPANVPAFIHANIVPSLLKLLQTGNSLGRESAAHMLTCIEASGGGDIIARNGGSRF